MKNEVVIFLKKLTSSDLFGAVGNDLKDEGVIRVNNWESALRCYNSMDWENFNLDRHNEMFIFDPDGSLFSKSYDVFLTATNKIIEDQVKEATSSLPIGFRQKKKVFKQTSWHLSSACLEIEYREKLSFQKSIPWHCELAEWYFRGRFPCGWDGDWPESGERNGKLIVF